MGTALEIVEVPTYVSDDEMDTTHVKKKITKIGLKINYNGTILI